MTGMTDDPVVAALWEVAAAVYPTVLYPEIQAGTTSLSNPLLVRTLYADSGADPAHGRVLDAIRDDPALSALLAGGDELGAFIHTNLGSGYRIQAGTLVGVFVETAAKSVVAQGLATDSITPLLEELSRTVIRVRRLLAGEADDGVALTAFAGIGIRDGLRLSTPWGSLRAASSSERAQRPFGGPPPSAILQTPIPIRWTLGEGDVTISDELTTVMSQPDLLALAIVLAFGRGTPAQQLWVTTLAPLQLGGGYRTQRVPDKNWPHPPWAEPPTSEPLTDEQAAALVAWANRVARLYHPSISVAVRRTLSAVAERSFNAEDALIDAVIAWENLFGTGGTSEMTFRITAALAILLEATPDARPNLRSELSKVYGLRSKVAHGGEVTPKDHLPERKDRAVDVGIDALRTLFESHPSLISNPDRGMHLILGLAGRDPGGLSRRSTIDSQAAG